MEEFPRTEFHFVTVALPGIFLKVRKVHPTEREHAATQIKRMWYKHHTRVRFAKEWANEQGNKLQRAGMFGNVAKRELPDEVGTRSRKNVASCFRMRSWVWSAVIILLSSYGVEGSCRMVGQLLWSGVQSSHPPVEEKNDSGPAIGICLRRLIGSEIGRLYGVVAKIVQ